MTGELDRVHGDRAVGPGRRRPSRPGMTRGIANESTFRRLFARLDADVPGRVLCTWACTRAGVVKQLRACAIDGKSARGARGGSRQALPRGGVRPRQRDRTSPVRAGSKASGITAVRTLLDLLDRFDNDATRARPPRDAHDQGPAGPEWITFAASVQVARLRPPSRPRARRPSRSST